MPSPSGPGEKPQVQVWTKLDWAPPQCLPWAAGRYRFVAAVAGAVDAADADDLLRRLGAISATAGVRYWSVTENDWRVLIESATALTNADDGAARADFAPPEMRSGSPLYFREKDNRTTNPTVYRMRVLVASPDEVVVESTNATPIESFGLTLLPPATLHLAYVARRTPSQGWFLYLLSAADAGASSLVTLGKDSYVNRAVALFGHVAGTP